MLILWVAETRQLILKMLCKATRNIHIGANWVLKKSQFKWPLFFSTYGVAQGFWGLQDAISPSEKQICYGVLFPYNRYKYKMETLTHCCSLSRLI